MHVCDDMTDKHGTECIDLKIPSFEIINKM